MADNKVIYEEHKRRMREKLHPKAPIGGAPDVLQRLMEQARNRRLRKPKL